MYYPTADPRHSRHGFVSISASRSSCATGRPPMPRQSAALELGSMPLSFLTVQNSGRIPSGSEASNSAFVALTCSSMS